MKLPHRRQFLHLAAGAAALPAVSRVAKAQNYPTRPVRFIVAFAPGGANDIVARLIGQWLSVRLGQQFVIENRAGAGSNIGTEVVVRAPPDGYVLLMVGTPNAINATLYEKLPFDFIRDVAPVASILHLPLVMEVNPSVPAATVPEFIAYAKANPGKINMASGGNGGVTHVAGELFKILAGVDITHVPYRGEAPALTDLLGGQVNKCEISLCRSDHAFQFLAVLTLVQCASQMCARSAGLRGYPKVELQPKPRVRRPPARIAPPAHRRSPALAAAAVGR
jgi:tripartite-type tricarboxylate transporter receptor subunit TctC